MTRRIGRPRSCECGECKKCKHRLYMAQWYAGKTTEERRMMIASRDKEKVRANDRRRAPSRVAHLVENTRHWRKNHPKQYAAHQAVAKAIKKGELVRQPCERCGAEKVHAHHDDYNKPLDVRWLCPLHHSAVHYEMERA